MTEARLHVTSASERPDLAARARQLQVWPEFQRHGVVVNRYWSRLYESFPDFQLVVHDSDADEIVAEGHTIPCAWDGTVPGLPEGIDELLASAFALKEQGGAPNTLSALAIEVAAAHQGRGVSTMLIRAMVDLARARGFGDLIAPLRPTAKERYPLTAIDDYATWTRGDGQPFDPWIRTHRRLGADILRTAPRSLEITGTVAEWERWTGQRFSRSGSCVFAGGLAPVEIDLERDRGTYWEPNVWVRHRVAAG